MKETWKKIWVEVEVSDLGNVKFDINKLQPNVRKNTVKVKKYDEPTLVKVKFKEHYSSYLNTCKKKKVICLDTNQWFESLKAACKYFKISPSGLSSCLTGKKFDVNGLHWAYYTE